MLVVGEGTSRAMYEVYSLDGFEKWSKALIADLRFLALIPGIGETFKECLKTVEAQKILCHPNF